jgi:hypothetical protein
MGGRGAFHVRYKPDREDWSRVMEETLPAQVAIRRVRTPPAESLRFPEQGQSAQGKSGPKPRPKGVGERADRLIFLHRLKCALSNGVTRKDKHTDDWKRRVAARGGSPRQIREAANSKGSQGSWLRPAQLADFMPPRKTSS